MIQIFSIVESLAFYVLTLAMFFRAWRGRAISRFPLFYTYLFYMLVTGAISLFLYVKHSPAYALDVWARLLTGSVAEFVVLLEVSDHLFARFAIVRRLGQFLTAVICAGLLAFYVLPILAQGHTSHDLILEFFKRASVTKAAVIVVLLVACRIYRLPLEPEVGGIFLGFTVFLASNIVNVTLLERFQAAGYGLAFGIIGPVSYTLGMLIWTIALWNPKHAFSGPSGMEAAEEIATKDMKLKKLNASLTRLLRR